MPRVLIYGSDLWRDAAFMRLALNRVHADRGFATVISPGGSSNSGRFADGVFAVALQWAKDNNVPFEMARVLFSIEPSELRISYLTGPNKPDIAIQFGRDSGANHLTSALNSARITTAEFLAVQTEETYSNIWHKER